MRKIYPLLLICCITVLSFGQSAKVTTHKLGGLMLYNKLQDPKYAQSNALKHIMVKGDPGMIRELVARYKGVFKYSAGQVSSVAVPYKNLVAFSQSKGIVRIEGFEGVGKGHSFMDTARIRNNIDSAQQGIAPLTQAYKGSGVLVGIIDGGIYFRHQDFRRANGNTRIKYIWDQVDTTGNRTGLLYGSDWDSTAINAGLCGHKEPSSDQGHGTNVAGIAAGNGLSEVSNAFLNGKYTGVAPDADMIIVSVNNNASDYEQAITDAVQYIFAKADLLGRPCVINTSVGTYYGPHDGSELQVQAMENMLDQKKGRVIVAAAGNGGAIKHHVSYTLSPTDSLFTWFTYNSTTHQVYFDLWADTAQFKNATFALGCDAMTNVYRGRTKYFNVITDFSPLPQGTTNQISDTLYDGAHAIVGLYTVAVTAYEGLYHVEFLVAPTVTTNLWRLQTLGQGTFDLWASKSLIGTSSIATTYPTGWVPSPNYRYGDSIKTVVSAWQCSDKIITVGNYNSRSSYLDKDSIYQSAITAPDVVGGLAATSSLGPTRDGRIKPDITATGNVICSTGDSTYIANLIGSGQGYKVAYGSKHTRNGGTSMSSPIVAGCACLYLQEHPNATYDEVKTVLQLTAKKDSFTSLNNIPNTHYGWGKVNCYQALLYQVVYGCKDTGSINYNANANIDTGGCIPKVYGCTDTGSINYNALANVNNGSCVPKVYGVMDTLCTNYNHLANVSSGPCIHVGIAESPNGDIDFEVIPNPFSKTTTIHIYTSNPLSNAEVRFYDALGKSVDAVRIPANTKDIEYNNTKLAAGIYEVAIVSNSSIIAIKKVVVE